MKVDFYKVLNISKSASSDDIKTAYRKLVFKYHPDVNKSADAENQFKQLNEAYEVLSDENKREEYDSTLSFNVVNTKATEPSSNNYGANNYRANSYGVNNHGAYYNVRSHNTQRKEQYDVNMWYHQDVPLRMTAIMFKDTWFQPKSKRDSYFYRRDNFKGKWRAFNDAAYEDEEKKSYSSETSNQSHSESRSMSNESSNDSAADRLNNKRNERRNNNKQQTSEEKKMDSYCLIS